MQPNSEPSERASTTKTTQADRAAQPVAALNPWQRQVAKPVDRDYNSVRDDMRAGDLLCFRGRGPLSWIIRLLTRGWYSHVGLIFWFEGRNYCIEAVGSGVRIILMSELKRRYRGGIDYFELKDVDDKARRGTLGFCFAQLGRHYDRLGVFRFVWALVLKRFPKARQDKRWFCSELVTAAYNEQGVELAIHDASYTSPHDLAVSPRTSYLFTIKQSR